MYTSMKTLSTWNVTPVTSEDARVSSTKTQKLFAISSGLTLLLMVRRPQLLRMYFIPNGSHGTIMNIVVSKADGQMQAWMLLMAMTRGSVVYFPLLSRQL